MAKTASDPKPEPDPVPETPPEPTPEPAPQPEKQPEPAPQAAGPMPMGIGIMRIDKQGYRDWIAAGGTPPIYT